MLPHCPIRARRKVAGRRNAQLRAFIPNCVHPQPIIVVKASHWLNPTRNQKAKEPVHGSQPPEIWRNKEENIFTEETGLLEKKQKEVLKEVENEN
jgi:hypothetical protein